MCVTWQVCDWQQVMRFGQGSDSVLESNFVGEDKCWGVGWITQSQSCYLWTALACCVGYSLKVFYYLAYSRDKHSPAYPTQFSLCWFWLIIQKVTGTCILHRSERFRHLRAILRKANAVDCNIFFYKPVFHDIVWHCYQIFVSTLCDIFSFVQRTRFIQPFMYQIFQARGPGFEPIFFATTTTCKFMSRTKKSSVKLH